MGKMKKKTTTKTGQLHDYIWNLSCIGTDESEIWETDLNTKNSSLHLWWM